MTIVLQFMQGKIDTFIFGFGLIVLALLFWNGSALSSKKSSIKEKLYRNNKKYIRNSQTGEIEEIEDKDASVTPDTIRGLEKEFNACCTRHSVIVQFIPIFPLLGILGTVVGLMLEVQAKDIDVMLESINTALTSTFLGLIFAIVLKFIEAVFPSKIIMDVNVMLDDFDKKLDLAEMFQKPNEEI